ncbi:MAG: DUF11 domain-containing protein, partial [Patescibacteria group bacterium]
TDLAPGTYYWRVKAKDAKDNFGPWSGIWQLTITATPTPTPTATPSATPTTSPTATGTPGGSCSPSQIGLLSYSGDGTSATVKNNSGGQCTVGLASYKVFDQYLPEFLSTQELFDTDVRTLANQQEATLNVGTPGCAYQTDVFTGSAPSNGNGFNGSNFIEARIIFTGLSLCGETATTPQVTPSPTSTTNPLSCNPPLQFVDINQNANLVAAGGTGTYSWSAPSGVFISNTGPAFSVRYTTEVPSTKLVTVTDGVDSAECVVAINLAVTPTPTPTPTPTATTTATATPTATATSTTTPTTTPTVTPTPTPSPTSTSTSTPAPLPAPILNLDKLVRNISTGGAEADVTSAQIGDTVEFVIRLTASYRTVLNLRLFDTLPNGLTLIGGTTTVNGTAVADTLTTTAGLLLGDIVPGQPATVRFRAVVSGASIVGGTSSLVNTTTFTSTSVPSFNDTAVVNITNITGTNLFTLVKLGRNVTQNQTSEQSSVNANRGDVIEFTVRVRANATPLVNVVVRDIIPTGMTYIPGSTTLDSVVISDGIETSGGIILSSVAAYQERAIRLRVRVDQTGSVFAAGNNVLVNTVTAQPQNSISLQAELPITVFIGSIIGPVSQVPTGPLESILLAALIAALITGLYVGYTRTAFFTRREIGTIIEKQQPMNFRFGLTVVALFALLTTFIYSGQQLGRRVYVQISGSQASQERFGEFLCTPHPLDGSPICRQVSAPVLNCLPESQTVRAGTIVRVDAIGGDERYSWNAPNAVPDHGLGKTLYVIFSPADVGTHGITVTSGSDSARCSVRVTR